MRKIWGMACVCLLWIMVGGSALAESVTVTDMAGRSVTAPFDPDRIICIGPGALRLIVYLEAQGKVSGVEEMEKMNPRSRPYWIAHPELAHLPRCGPGGPAGINKKPDMEAILSVNPQVIFITYMDKQVADEVEASLKIPVVVLSYGTFATFDKVVYDAIRIAGKILNRNERAEAVISLFESLQADLDRRTRNVPDAAKPGVYVGGIGHRGAWGIESTEQRYIPFDWVHAKNLAEKLTTTVGSHVFVDKEQLLSLDPDVIFMDGGGISILKEDFGKKPEFYEALKAFQIKRVYTLHPFNSYTTNIGTALIDAYAIGKTLYPDAFTDVDLDRKAGEIYQFLMGKNIQDEMKKDYGEMAAHLQLKKN
jgi:iron complex transport system substrate-binding protein